MEPVKYLAGVKREDVNGDSVSPDADLRFLKAPDPAIRHAQDAESLVERFNEGGQSAWVEALREVVAIFKGTGGEVALMSEFGKPNLLFRCGEVQLISDKPEIYEFYTGLWERQELVGQCISTWLKSDPRFACCAFVRSKNEILGVDIWGDSKTRFEDLIPLQVFLQAVNHSLPRTLRSVTSEKPDYVETSPQLFPPGYVTGQSEAAILLHRELEILSVSELPILLVGETGVGKEHLAHLIHRWSRRPNRPFVAVNCAAIPAELFEAEMFGIGRGVASGVTERGGYFQEAHEGTLFLDEIGEMPPPLQAKLLRALQAKEIRRVGGEVLKTDVRIVAATNSDIETRITEGTFRLDLYYRLAGAVVRVPALRERQEDISLFVQYYADLYAWEANKTIKGITLWALELLTQYAWPGNVRELEHEVRRLVYLCPEGQLMEAAMLPERIRKFKVAESSAHSPHSLLIEPNLAELERSLIRDALTRTKGNQTQAAKLLGTTRNGLAIKMQRLGIGLGRLEPPSLDQFPQR